MPYLTSSIVLTSPAFADNTLMPIKYTFYGDNVSPPLRIANTPYGTHSMVLLMHAPNTQSGDWLHWSLYNIPREVTEIPENTVPDGALQGVTSSNKTSYSGPHPPKGTGVREYHFELYALGVIFELESGADWKALELLLGHGNIVAQTRLTGLFTIDPT